MVDLGWSFIPVNGRNIYYVYMLTKIVFQQVRYVTMDSTTSMLKQCVTWLGGITVVQWQRLAHLVKEMALSGWMKWNVAKFMSLQ